MTRDAIVNCHAGRGVPRCGTCRMCRELAALTHEPAREFEALPALSPNPAPGFSLYAKPRRRGVGDDARAQNVDDIIAWARRVPFEPKW